MSNVNREILLNISQLSPELVCDTILSYDTDNKYTHTYTHNDQIIVDDVDARSLQRGVDQRQHRKVCVT